MAGKILLSLSSSLSGGIVAGLGVAYGGWRIIKTLGMRITPLVPEQGFVSDFSAASVMQIASFFGIPVSTTQVDASAILELRQLEDSPALLGRYCWLFCYLGF